MGRRLPSRAHPRLSVAVPDGAIASGQDFGQYRWVGRTAVSGETATGFKEEISPLVSCDLREFLEGEEGYLLPDFPALGVDIAAMLVISSGERDW